MSLLGSSDLFQKVICTLASGAGRPPKGLAEEGFEGGLESQPLSLRRLWPSGRPRGPCGDSKRAWGVGSALSRVAGGSSEVGRRSSASALPGPAPGEWTVRAPPGVSGVDTVDAPAAGEGAGAAGVSGWAGGAVVPRVPPAPSATGPWEG